MFDVCADEIVFEGRTVGRLLPLNATLADRRREEVEVVRTGVVEKVLREVLLRQVAVGLDEAVERPTAVADDDLQVRVALEGVTV